MRSVTQKEHVAQWIERMRGGDDSAAELLWQHCFFRVANVARRHLRGGPVALADEEDIALSAIKSLCLGLQAGRFPALACDDGLWRLLLVITARKVSDQINYSTRQKRNVNRNERASPEHSPESLLQSLLCRRPTPDTEAEIAEQLRQLLDALEHDDLRRVAIMKMDGYTNQEIARQLNRGVSTIERKLRVIRSIWKQVA